MWQKGISAAQKEKGRSVKIFHTDKIMEQYNILIVEDDKEIRDGIEIFLKSQNYNVYKAADGIEGLEIIESKEIHLAIVDIMMPRMDGVTMTLKLREHHDFPVIMLRRNQRRQIK